MLGRLPEIRLFLRAGGGRGEFQGGRVELEAFVKGLVFLGEAEENLIREFVVRETRWIERLDEVEIEVARRDGRGTFAGRAEEKVAQAGGLALFPDDFMLPDLPTGEAGGVRTLEDLAQRVVIVAVEDVAVEGFGPLFDQGVVILHLFQIEVVLAVVFAEGDELAAHRAADLVQRRFHNREQIGCGIAGQRGNGRMIEAQAVAELLGR